MKFVCTSALVAALAASTFAQDTPAPTPPPKPEAEPARQPAPDAESVKQAEKVITEMSKAYKDAKTISDTLQLKMESAMMGSQTQEMTIAIGTGKDASMAVSGLSLIAVDGKLHVLRSDVADKFYAVPMEGSLQDALDSVFGGGFPLPPQFVLRSETQTDRILKSASLGMMNEPKLTGHRETTNDEGVKVHEITFASNEGKGTMHVLADSKLLKRVAMEIHGEQMPAETMKATLTLSPKVHDELPTPIAFNAGSRKAVNSLDELAPTPISVGDEAPDFTLATLSGESVTLSKLRGSVVVLDFWATWCNPCRRGLPLLEEFNTWAQTSGQSVKVYAVNVIERTKDPKERKAKVEEFWTKGTYKMPTLLDLEDVVFPKYGFDGIPATVVVGPDGKIAAIHQGFSPDMVETLKKDVAAAMKTSG
jgi:thiol-disulfide isomerase/thioredoxin